MTEYATQAALDTQRWNLEDRINGMGQTVNALERTVHNLGVCLDAAASRIDGLAAEMATLRQTLTAVILLSIEHEDAIDVAEQVLRERGQHGLDSSDRG